MPATAGRTTVTLTRNDKDLKNTVRFDAPAGVIAGSIYVAKEAELAKSSALRITVAGVTGDSDGS